MPTAAGARFRSAVPLLLALAICAYGACLRLYALNSRYGPIRYPGWARVLVAAGSVAPYLEPQIYGWPPIAHPYVGGDPANYLRFAREMRSFYQAHVREPVFLAITRGYLWLLGGQDVAVSFASATLSTFAILATFLLGRAAFSPAVGLLAALGFAVDYDVVNWSTEGWRDDTFTCMLVLTTFALVRLRQTPTAPRSLIAGVCGAAACLTRITSITWLVPALLVLPLGSRDAWRRRAAMTGLAALVAAALVAPYLINCARQYGDPLFAINYHTIYYRAGEGSEYKEPLSAYRYITGKLTRRPVSEADVALTGVFVFPMQNKWSGFAFWAPHLNDLLMIASIAGLLLFLTTSTGRLLLVVIVTSLVPYAFTWNIAGGGEWRFTMHVYPLYLIAAFYAFDRALRGAWSLRHRERWKPTWTRRQAAVGTAAAGLLALGWIAYLKLPYFVERESLLAGDPVTIATGWRDGVFYTRGWSEWRREGMVTARVVIGERASVRFALPEPRAYRIALRVDPATADVPHFLTLLLNGRLLNRYQLGLNPERVGSHYVDVPAYFVQPGPNELTLVADAVVPAGDAGPRYAWMAPSTPISVRVWYLRIHPL